MDQQERQRDRQAREDQANELAMLAIIAVTSFLAGKAAITIGDTEVRFKIDPVQGA